LLSPLIAPVPDAPLAFRRVRDDRIEPQILELGNDRPFAVVNPGGRLDWRRVPTAVFAAAARRLLETRRRVIVTWGPNEEALAREVVAAAPGAILPPPTSLDALAWHLANAQVAVCNNTGPMHLAVAVGTPTLGLFLRMDPARWGHSGPRHRMVDLTPIIDNGGSGESAVVAALESLEARTEDSRTGGTPTVNAGD
jgi:ADP-heptose:LPS heptosyltransferase